MLVDAFRANSTGVASNGKLVAQYLSGVLPSNKKLDYVIMTHAHTDHLGGIVDIMNYIDSNTVVFYKEVGYTESDGEYVCTTGCASDANLSYYVNSVNALNNANAVMCALSGTITSNFGNKLSTACKNKLKKNDANYTISTGSVNNTNIDDTLKFTMGNNLTVNLYNLYHISDDKENQNSIVTLLTTTGGKKILLTGDIQANNVGTSTLGFENEIANLIYDVINKNSSSAVYLDILKVPHHGESTSNSYYFITKLKPKIMVVQRTDNVFEDGAFIKFGAAMGIVKKQGGKIYGSRNSSGAVVAEITGSTITMMNYTASGVPANYSEDGVSTTNNAALEIGQYVHNGWYVFQNKSRGKSWTDYKNQYGSNDNIKPDEYLKVYINNGTVVTGWQKIGNNWYYFDKYGVLLTDWQKISNNWYYLKPFIDTTIEPTYTGDAFSLYNKLIDDSAYGSMQTGLVKDGSYYYYMNGTSSSASDYLKGVRSTGWQKIGNNWHYFCKTNKEVGTYPEGSMIVGNGTNTTTISGFDSYKFDADGNLINYDESALFSGSILIDSSNKILKKVNIGETSSNLKKLITLSGTVVIKNNSGSTISDSSKICTGYGIDMVLNSKTLSYSLSVNGDVLGKGYIDKAGVKKAANNLLIKNPLNNNAYYLATDYNDDGSIKVNDIMMMIRDINN